MGEFPSGQRGQTVNLLRFASMVRIRPPPPAKSTIRFGWCFLLVWVLGGRIRKAALCECPVDTCNRRGFSAEKRIRPPPPQDLKLWLQVLFFISDSNHKIAIVRWTMAHARPDGHDTLLLPIHASLIRNSGVSFLYRHSSRKDELTFKSRQKQDYTIIEILIFTPFRKWWKSVINHRILLQKCRNRVHSVSYHFKKVTFHFQ